MSHGDGCGDSFCPSERGAVDGWCDGAPHRPSDLKNMLRWWHEHGSTYNEIIVDVAYMDVHLPESVEAILQDAAVHSQFIEYYGVDAKDYPLVAFDPHGPIPFYMLS